MLFITILEDVPFPIIPNICFLNLPLVIIRTVIKKVKGFFSICSVNQKTVTIFLPVFHSASFLLTAYIFPPSHDSAWFYQYCPADVWICNSEIEISDASFSTLQQISGFDITATNINASRIVRSLNFLVSILMSFSKQKNSLDLM